LGDEGDKTNIVDLLGLDEEWVKLIIEAKTWECNLKK
jgi:hypothetical protein